MTSPPSIKLYGVGGQGFGNKNFGIVGTWTGISTLCTVTYLLPVCHTYAAVRFLIVRVRQISRPANGHANLKIHASLSILSNE
jgi:hypothetical protein